MEETNICQLIDFENLPDNNKEVFDRLRGSISTLETLYHGSNVLNIDDLLVILNYISYSTDELCVFCKGEIVEDKYETLVILHTTEKLGIEIIKDLLMDPEDVKVESKPYKHPYEEDITERYKLTFSYWQIVDDLKTNEWNVLNESIDFTKDWLQY